MFWIFAALLTAIAVFVVLYPLSRKRAGIVSADAYDLNVYKSQLKEIEGDVDRGLIAKSEAEAAKAEVARRLISTQSALDEDEKQVRAENPGTSHSNIKIASVIALLVVPVVSLAFYFNLGDPALQSQPLAERLERPPEKQSLIERVASVERVLKAKPDDIRGWKLIAPIYLKMRRPKDAIRAYRHVIRLEGENAANLSDLGEAMVVEEGGLISQNAARLFIQANRIDPKAPKPRFFLAIALGQKDKNKEAIAAWQALMADAGPNSAWVPFAQNQIAALKIKMGEASTTDQPDSQLAGPTEEDVKSAAEMSAKERQEMVENMVSQLAQRLDEEGGSAEEWVRLIRAELVLKRPDMASKTVIKAMQALQSDIEGLEKVKAAARSLGLSINQ